VIQLLRLDEFVGFLVSAAKNLVLDSTGGGKMMDCGGVVLSR